MRILELLFHLAELKDGRGWRWGQWGSDWATEEKQRQQALCPPNHVSSWSWSRTLDLFWKCSLFWCYALGERQPTDSTAPFLVSPTAGLIHCRPSTQDLCTGCSLCLACPFQVSTPYGQSYWFIRNTRHLDFTGHVFHPTFQTLTTYTKEFLKTALI